MGFAQDILADLDEARSIAGSSDMGLHPWTVTLRVTTWSGGAAGIGTATTTDTAITVGGSPTKVTKISIEDVVASGGTYQAGDIRVGPLTPAYPGGGTAATTINPATSGSATEVQYILTRDGATSLWKRVRDESDSALHYYLILRSMGRA